MEQKQIGKVTHFFGKINVVVIVLKDTLKTSDKIHIQGATTDFEQSVASMQVEHKEVSVAGKGDSVGIKVKDHCRENDVVYIVTD